MKRLGRKLWVWLAAGIGLAWLLPSLAAPYVLRALLPEPQLELVLDGVRPALPLGLSVRRLDVRHPRWQLALENSSLLWKGTHLTLRARLAGGELQARAQLSGRKGSLRFSGLALEELPFLAGGTVALQGRAEGVASWGPVDRVSCWISDGRLQLRSLGAIGLPFSLAVVEAVQLEDDRWQLTTLQLHGPQLTLDGTGTIGPEGSLELALQIRAVDSGTRALLRAAGLRLGSLPRPLIVEGTLRSPRLRLP